MTTLIAHRPTFSLPAALLAALFAMTLATSCADTPAPQQALFDIQPFDAAVDAGIAADGGLDGGATEQDVAPQDVPEPDTAGAGCPGGVGCECKANGDCDNAICIDDPTVDNATGKVCARTCVDGCPAGYKCVQAAPTGGDAIGLCVPEYGNLCHPCYTSNDCKSVGHTDPLCVDQGDLGAFCGMGCAADSDCPETYACQDVTSIEGASAKQCVKVGEGGGYGVCDCSKLAVKQKLTTDCVIQYKDTEGEVVASCKGTRSCLPAGLSKCAAPAVGNEVCDGKDNDCDGDVDEGTCDDGNGCTVDACDGKSGKCTQIPAQDGLACEADGSACTDGDACQGGKCKAGKPLDCDDTNPCTKDSCDPKTGCKQAPADGVSCSDDNPCTIGDVCKDQSCQSGKPKTCSSPSACKTAKCSVKTGKCEFNDAIEGLPCEDGSKCTEDDACKAGACKAGKVVDCNDGNVCTTNKCDGVKGCVTTVNAKPCDGDQNACTVGDICKDKVCVTGKLKSCDDSNPCTSDSCDKGSGKCVFNPKPNDGDPCDDGKGCTQKDTCSGGVCKGKNASCDDGNPCTIDKCDAGAGKCVHSGGPNEGKACDDNEACTKGDKCTGGKCAGVGKVCNDGNPCTVDKCSVSSGTCSYDANVTQGKACEDGNACTKGDKCASGKCVGVAVVCNDGNPCTADACDAKLGKCVYSGALKDNATCDDGNKCTSGDKCTGGKCAGGAVSCDDGDPCTIDSCDSTQGCKHKTAADGTTCSDNGQQVCKAGKCVGKCSSTCPKAGVKQCGAGGGVQTCGDYNKDGCVEWDKEIACKSYQVCKTGACVQKQAPFKLVINEVLYDNVGVDKATFVELRGPKGADLSGWSLVGLDGNGGKVYATVPLKGVIPADGFFVVAKKGAPQPLAGQAEMFSSAVDFQNGPDSVQLVYGGDVVDAVGYGVFGGSIIFKGEGKPTADAPSGSSIGRDAKGTDTDNNSVDFAIFKTPSPGKANVTPNLKPKAAIKCPGSGKPGQALSFDGSGSSDPDGKIVSYTFDFGDGTPKTQGSKSTATHAYAKAGSYTVKLIVVDDKGAPDVASCSVTVGVANKAPVASLSCPGAAQVGAVVPFDASGSSDPDGSIKSYTFVFGDGSSAATGTAPKASHTYKKTGVFKASVKVTDDKGASATAYCSLTVGAAAPPVVLFVKPQSGSLVTQGEKVAFLVDATAKGGKSIKTVTLKQGSKVIGADSSAPYTFSWTVPAGAATGSTLSFTAVASDTGGGVGSSPLLKLKVVNDKPKAAFTAIVTGALEVALDASFVSDTETPKSALQVRWDFENDGKWDTPFSKTKTMKKTYPKQGSYTIKMEVKDAVGQTATATRNVNLSLIKQVAGTINTTTWVGTIIVTGDIIVPKGQVLTIAKGTSVQFAPIDQNKDGYGDYNVYVYGKLNVVGSAGQPVVFTVYGSKKTPGKAWQRIQLKGEGSTISHAIIEYARWGIEIRDTSTVSDTTVRLSYNGIRALSPAKLSGSGLKVTQNLDAGIYATSGTTLNIDKSEVTGNGAEGIYAWANGSTCTLNLSASTVSGNKRPGVRLYGRVAGKIMHNLITANDWEGLRIAPYQSFDPTVVVNYNNIFGNALVGAREVTNLKAYASKTGSGSGYANSTAKGTPSGAPIDHLHYNYGEKDSYNNYVRGYVRNGSSSGAVLVTQTSKGYGWVSLLGKNVKKVVAQVYKSSSSSYYYGTMSVTVAAWDKPGLKREVSVLTRAHTVDMRHNYYGVFPDVLSRITLSHPAAANVHGFVGVKFGADWKKGPYYGGETLGVNTTWSDTIWLTGDLKVDSGKTLTIAPGTQVHVVYHDQDKNGVGDFDIYASGAIVAKAPADAPILIHGYGAGQKVGKGWALIVLAGKGSVFQNVVVEHAVTGVQASSTATFTNVTLRNNDMGLRAASGSNVTLTSSLVHKNADHGLEVRSGGKLTVVGGKVVDNGGSGVYCRANSSSTLLKATGVTFSGNKRMGIELKGRVPGLITHCQITANGHEGIRLEPYTTYDPEIKVQYNNIWGNALVGARVVYEIGVSATKSGSGSGYGSSSTKGTPLGETIDYLYYAYSEKDSYNNYVRGYVRKDSGSGATLVGVSSGTSGWKDVRSSKVSKLMAQVYKSSSSSYYYGTMSVPRVAYDKKGLKRQVSVISKSKTVDMRFNWFGVFPGVLSAVSMSHPKAVNLHGFVGVKFGSNWSRGPYRGGESLAKNESWSGTVWITGDLVVPTGKVLTLASGTQVRFVAHDQDKNGVGDFDITIHGTLDAQGKSGAKVAFTVEGAGNQKKKAWSRLFASGSGSKLKLTHTDVAWGESCVYLGSGTHTLAYTKVSNCGTYGVRVQGGTSVSLANVELSGHSDHGLFVQSSKNVVIAGATIKGNGGEGIYVRSSTSGLVFKDMMITKNKKAGIHQRDASVKVANCNLSYNQIGIRYTGGSGGDISLSDVKYNDNEGVLLESNKGKSPSPKLNNNNIFGNSVEAGGVVYKLALSATKSGSGSGYANSAVKGLPGGKELLLMRYSYTEKDSYNNYVRGYVRRDSSSGATLAAATSYQSARWVDLRGMGVKKLMTQVYKSSSSSYYHGTMSVPQAFYRVAKQPRELVALTDAYKVSCTANYWGVFPDVLPLLALSRSDAVDFSGMKLMAVPGTGPQ